MYDIISVSEPEIRTYKQGKYPFDKLEVGQGFKVSAYSTTNKAMYKQCFKWGKRYGCKFQYKLVDDNKNVLVWRVN